jgi:histidyl-tRNA synthetase
MTEPVKFSPLQAVKGMNDILPPESANWNWLEDTVRALMTRYGYANIRTPIVEPTSLFVRGLGEVTDIVEKEMYSFQDAMNGDRLTLRPEATAGVVRAVNEHTLLHEGGKRLYYIGPMFRHERPQKGRYRQFHQVGAEALGFTGPDVDAELILMCRALWQALGLAEGRDIRLELNSLGEATERLEHRQALIAYFEQHIDQLDEEAKRRLHTNPLRLLDSKNPSMQALIEGAPQLIAFLGDTSKAHLQAVRDVLDAAGLPYKINPRLVRGMDYYNLTVFEWVTDHLGSQSAVCGGGRYDGLIAQLGGKSAPAVGWGLGMERLLLLLQAVGVQPPVEAPVVYAVVPNQQALPQVMKTLEDLRTAGVSVLMHAGGHSLKTQFKRADHSGAQYALIFGDDELARGEVALKPLRDANAVQKSLTLSTVTEWAAQLRSNA